MKKKNIIILVSLVLLIILSNVNQVRGEGEVQSSTLQTSTLGYIETIATHDSFIDSNIPNNNFGDLDFTVCGWAQGEMQVSYFYFPFTNKPNNYINVSLRFYIDGVFDGMTGGDTVNWTWGILALVDSIWNQDSITWNNQPTLGSAELLIAMWSDGWMNLNMTNTLRDIEDAEISINGFSICIYPIFPSDNSFALISSTEYGGIWSPTLIWEYEIPLVIVRDGGSSSSSSSSKTKPDEIPLGDFYLVFAIVGIISLIIYYKKIRGMSFVSN